MKLNGKLGTEKFVLDHLGVAVESLAKAVDFYERTLGLSVSGYETIPQEKTNVALLPLGGTRMNCWSPPRRILPSGSFSPSAEPGFTTSAFGCRTCGLRWPAFRNAASGW